MSTPNTMELTFAAATDVGRQRTHNEDNFLIDKKLRLFLVADGMGGHAAGEVASSIAVHEVRDAIHNNRDLIDRYRVDHPGVQSYEILQLLEHAVQAACGAVHARAQAEQDKRGMGTTATVLLIAGGGDHLRGFIAHVGDSRCYHLRGDRVLWRTADHTRVQRMVEMGILTAEQARTHEDANVVTRALGFSPTDEPPEPEIAAARELRDGDLLVLCSDGLYDLVDDMEIAELGSEDPPTTAAQRLVDLANERGGHDNITVTVARWGSAAPARTGPRKTDRDLPPSRATTKTADLASSVARARATLAGNPQRSRALGLAVGGLVLVALALAVFLMTRGGP